MNVLILSPVSNSYFGTLNWIKDDTKNYYYIVINKRHTEDYKKNCLQNVEYIIVDVWQKDLISYYVKKLHAEKHIDKIFTYTEEEVLLAAELRNILGIKGQGITSAKCFRDKYLMASFISEMGINTPKFKMVESYFDLDEFTKYYGYPIVIKPLDGGGAIGVTVVRDEAELKGYIAENAVGKKICEKFIPYDVYHVDGMVLDGKIKYTVVWKYIKSCLNFQNEVGGSCISMSMLSGTTTHAHLTQYARKVIMALPCPDNFLFHLEVFYNGEDIVFCEIASRMGGGRIIQCIHEEFGFNPIEELLKHETGRPVHKNLSKRIEFEKQYAFVLCGPKRGKITKIPEILPFNDVFDYHVFAKPGKVYGRAHSVVENVAAISIKSDVTNDIEQRIIWIDRWYKDACVYTQEENLKMDE